jgi:ketosteroid isomerase-like protein
MGQARETENRLTQAMLARDLEAARACYAPDVVATTPDAGTLHGVDQVVDYLRQSIEGFSDLGWEPTRELEAGDCAIDEGWQVATHSGDIALPDGRTVPASGKQIRIRTCDVAQVEGGVITRHDFYYDQLEFLAQLGLIEAPAATQA